VRLRSRRGQAKRADERPSERDNGQTLVGQPSRPTSQVQAQLTPTENLWSVVLHAISSWSPLARLVVLLLAITLLASGAFWVVWLLGFQIDLGDIGVGPASP
jgi:hypothetical protein